MSKKEEFKEFIRSKPELVNYIKNKEMTMQGFYEIYDIYGSNEEAWKPYLNNSSNTTKLSEILKNIDLDNVQKHINNAQKALGVVSELATKKDTDLASLVKGPLEARPLNKFFED